jgi:ferredoxin-thioredoxin reductase catalytic chain
MAEKTESEILKEMIEKFAVENGYSVKETELPRVIKGLIKNNQLYGGYFCPCRRVTDEPEYRASIVCPCKSVKEDIEEMGHCYCRLFYKIEEEETE